MRFLVFSIVFTLIAFFAFNWSIQEAIEFSSFFAGLLKMGLFLLVVSIIDYVVLWEFETFDQIIKERNLSYAIFLASLCLVAAAAIIGS